MTDYKTFQTDAGAVEEALEDKPKNKEEEEEELKGWRWNYYMSTFYLSVCAAFSNVAITLASSVMPDRIAVTGNGIYYTTACVMALILPGPVISCFGLKGAITFGSACSSLYLAGFVAAVALQGSVAEEIIWYVASVSGGVGRCITWTAQGAYMGATAIKMVEVGNLKYEEITPELSGWFALSYVGMEAVGRCGFSFMKLCLTPIVIALIYFSIATAASILTFFVRPLQGTKKMGAVFRLWLDPLMWCVIPSNMANGFITAYLSGYVNHAYVVPQLHEAAVGYMGTATSVLAAGCGHAIPKIAVYTGRFPMYFAGGVCYGAVAVCLLFLGCCYGWRDWLVLLYVFTGLGGSVYQSINRAAWADFFKDNIEQAFANFTLFANLAYAVGFFIQTDAHQTEMASIALFLAVAMPIGYLAAVQLHQGRQIQEKDLKKILDKGL